jgi:hypothetical protein
MESPAFIDERELLHNVIVEAIETDKQCANARGKCFQSTIVERVRLEFPVLERSDLVLFLLS